MRELNIKIVWMYHDIMDLYGDKGNMSGIEKTLRRTWYRHND